MSSTLYVRNCRPNAVLVRLPSLNNLKYTVERRGSREDTVALPPEAREDPVVATFLNQGILEEISKDTFMALASRPENEVVVGTDKRPRRVDSVALRERKAESEVNIPIHNPEESRTPYLIEDKDLRESAKLRTPRPEFAGRVPSTEEDIAAIEEAKRRVEAAANQVEPTNETEELRQQVTQLTNLVQELLARQPQVADTNNGEAAPKAKPKTRKTTTSGAKKTRASSAQKKS